MIFGTPEYMSPEQAQGEPADHRVDIYAVGCIMYQMLTGQVPFTADNFMGILTKHLLEPAVPPRKRRPDLDIAPDVEAICLRAMEKDRDKRFAGHGRVLSRARRGGRASVRAVAGVRPAAAAQGEPQVSDARRPPTWTRASRGRRSRCRARATFEDERPAARRGAGRQRKPAVIAIVVGGVALAIAGLVFALKPSGKPAAPEPAAAAANPAPTQGAAIAARGTDARGHAARARRGAETGGGCRGDGPSPVGRRASKPGRSSRRHRIAESPDDVKADPLHRAIPLPAETPAEHQAVRRPTRSGPRPPR